MRNRRTIGWTTAIALALATQAQAFAPPQFDFDIPPQALASALRAFCRTAHAQIVFDDTLVAGLRSTTVQGRFSTDQAVTRILAGSGLTVKQDTSGVYIVTRPAAQAIVAQTDTAPARPAKPAARPQAATTPTATTASTAAPDAAPAPSSGEAAAQPDAPTVHPDDITVVVTARRPTITSKIDRRVYNVSTSPQSSFATVNDVLSRVPSVTIDPHGAVALRGNTQVKILVDGNTAGANVIRNLPATEIDSVEVMTNPSAQYGSDGAAGIINIVSKKKRKEGWNGIWSARADDGGRYDLSGSASWKSGRWSIAAATGVNRTHDVSSESGQQHFGSGDDRQDNASTDAITRNGHRAFANINADYKLTPADTLGVTLSRNDIVSATRDINRARIAYATTAEAYDDDSANATEDDNADLALRYEHLGHVDGEHLTLSLSRSLSTSTDATDHLITHTEPAQSSAAYGTRTRGTDEGTAFTADYERPFADKSRLTTGVSWEQSATRTTRATTNIAAIVPGLADLPQDLAYDDRVAAAYVTYQRPFGKWVVMPGLRVEAEHRTVAPRPSGAATESDDLRWLPSLSVERFLSDDLTLTASYSRRTQKPYVYYLSPYRVYYSSTSAYAGNPGLDIQNTDSWELGYEYVAGGFSSNGSLYYRRNKGTLAPTRIWTEDHIVLSSWINADHSDALGVEWTAKGDLTKHLNYSLNLNLYDNQITGLVGGQALQRRGGAYSGNAVFEYKPRPRDWLQFTLSAQGRTLTLQGYTTGFYRLDMTYRYRLTPHWVLGVRGYDLLNSSKQRTVFTTPDGASASVRSQRRAGLMLGLAYKFGAGIQ